jgi:hypothetical protein
VRKGDVLLSVGGRTDLRRETDVLRHALNEVAVGEEIELELLRGSERLRVRIQTAR